MATRTPLFNRVQPGGVFTISDVINHPNDIWWVDSATGVDAAGYGQNSDAPVATIDYAVGLAAASPGKGDVIYVMPGHNEGIINATGLAVDKAGLSIIGLGRAMNRPIIDFDHADAKIIVSGANCRLSNLVFRASITDITLGLDVNASDLEVDNCFFTAEESVDEFIVTVDVTSVDRFYFHDNVVETWLAAAGSTKAINLVTSLDTVISNNVFRGTWTSGTIFGVTDPCLRLMILDNVIYNDATTVYCAIDPGLGIATTGTVKGNLVTALYATGVAKTVRKGNLTWHDNSFANAVAERAALAFPATSST